MHDRTRRRPRVEQALLESRRPRTDRGGSFREDLYYRLAGITLTIPPLRERTSEILPLAARFARASAEKMGKSAPALSSDAKDALLRYGWPGNVRELRNVMERAVVLASGNEIGAAQLPAKVLASGRESVPPPEPAADPRASSPAISPDDDAVPSLRSLRTEMEVLERKRIMEALERCGGNQTAAAELLGMSRRTLASRLGAYDLPRPRKR